MTRIGIGIGIGLAGSRGPSGPPNPITGTGLVLSALTEGDALSDAVTWGSYSSTAGTITDPTTRQMRIGAGDWVAFDTTDATAGANTGGSAGFMLEGTSAAADDLVVGNAALE